MRTVPPGLLFGHVTGGRGGVGPSRDVLTATEEPLRALNRSQQLQLAAPAFLPPRWTRYHGFGWIRDFLRCISF